MEYGKNKIVKWWRSQQTVGKHDFRGTLQNRGAIPRAADRCQHFTNRRFLNCCQKKNLWNITVTPSKNTLLNYIINLLNCDIWVAFSLFYSLKDSMSRRKATLVRGLFSLHIKALHPLIIILSLMLEILLNLRFFFPLFVNVSSNCNSYFV